jgi:Lon protease-like protein
MYDENYTIPLFPLGLVLFPGMPLPLHIFEERYKIMINECIEKKAVFGVVLIDGSQIQTVGCTAKILETLKRFPDGRMDILTIGENRFRILELIDSLPYLQAKISIFDDQLEPMTPQWHQLAEKGIRLYDQLETLSRATENIRSYHELDFKRLSFLFASTTGFTHSEKQRFLEMTSTFERLRKSSNALEKLMDRIRVSEKIEKIIGGNGNMPKSIQNHLKRNT